MVPVLAAHERTDPSANSYLFSSGEQVWLTAPTRGSSCTGGRQGLVEMHTTSWFPSAQPLRQLSVNAVTVPREPTPMALKRNLGDDGEDSDTSMDTGSPAKRARLCSQAALFVQEAENHHHRPMPPQLFPVRTVTLPEPPAGADGFPGGDPTTPHSTKRSWFAAEDGPSMDTRPSFSPGDDDAPDRRWKRQRSSLSDDTFATFPTPPTHPRQPNRCTSPPHHPSTLEGPQPAAGVASGPPDIDYTSANGTLRQLHLSRLRRHIDRCVAEHHASSGDNSGSYSGVSSGASGGAAADSRHEWP